MTADQFKEVMSKRTDADLVRITTVEKDQSQPDAITVAEEELKKRDIYP